MDDDLPEASDPADPSPLDVAIDAAACASRDFWRCVAMLDGWRPSEPGSFDHDAPADLDALAERIRRAAAVQLEHVCSLASPAHDHDHDAHAGRS